MSTASAAAVTGRRTNMRAGGGGCIGLVAVGALLVASGCGSGGDDTDVDVATAPEGYEATAQFLRGVIDGSEAEAHRYEMSMSIDIAGGGQSVEVDVMVQTGAFDGELYATRSDLGETLEATAEQSGESVPSELTGEDAVIEVVGDSDSLYVYAPFVADAGSALESIGAANPLYDVYEQLEDRWGYVDLTAAGETVAVQATGSNSFDPRAIADAIVDVDTVDELGQDELDGTTVTGLSAQTTLGDVLDAQGMDARDFAEQLGTGIGVPERMLESLTEVDLPIEVWTDRDGRVRQVVYSFTKDLMVDVLDAAGEDASAFDEQIDEFEMAFVVDYSDYGDGSIDIELPDRSEAVDITDDYLDALGV